MAHHLIFRFFLHSHCNCRRQCRQFSQKTKQITDFVFRSSFFDAPTQRHVFFLPEVRRVVLRPPPSSVLLFYVTGKEDRTFFLLQYCDVYIRPASFQNAPRPPFHPVDDDQNQSLPLHLRVQFPSKPYQKALAKHHFRYTTISHVAYLNNGFHVYNLCYRVATYSRFGYGYSLSSYVYSSLRPITATVLRCTFDLPIHSPLKENPV